MHEAMSSVPPRRNQTVLIGAAIAFVVVALVFFFIGKTSGSKTKTVSPATSVSASPRTTVSQAPVESPAGGVNAGKSGLPIVKAASLPPEARTTLKLIESNGPYPYSRDGVVYSNFEKILPKQVTGYYHEYTVVTPGASNRATRRIITGKKGERYYTDDHYASFKEVVG